MRPDEPTTSTTTELADWVRDARERSFDLVLDLTDEQLMVPKLPIVNPLVWELGHAAWFHEKWILRHFAGHEPLRPHSDSLYDSIAIAHEVRWDLPLPPRDDVFAYVAEVRDRVLEELDRTALSKKLEYFVKLSVFHEDMHTEAFTYTRQTLGYAAPKFSAEPADLPTPQAVADDAPHDVDVPGGEFLLGAAQDEPFVFDNEKWAHPVEIKPFSISRSAVTQCEFAAFVEDDGYRRREFWCQDGWNWRESEQAEHPVYWQKDSGGGWLRRDFDRWIPLEPQRSVLHVNWYEANAFCRWAGRRLPTEAEWEAAAASTTATNGSLFPEKRQFPWGDDPPNPQRANLDWTHMGAIDADALPASESEFGCRQLIGNVWEWTADTFEPFPGFAVDSYTEYSRPCFGSRKVLRGGCWVTRGRLLRNTWRNYYQPDRRDVWAGFRTCGVEG